MAQRPDDTTSPRIAQALALLGEGYSMATIGARLGLSPAATCRLLRRARAKMLPLIADESASLKVDQLLQLAWIYEQCRDSWLRSKTPRKRAAVRRTPGDGGDDGDEVQTTEVIERDGDTAYFTCAMAALRDQRMLLGLDVLAAENDGPSTIAAMVADMARRGELYEAERRARDAYGDSPDGNGSPS
jgi:hypothetical protein